MIGPLHEEQFSAINPPWRAVMRRLDRRPPWEWARDHIVLHEAYAIQGAFDPGISRYLIGPMDAIADELVREVHICGAIQTAKTLIVEICIPWIMANDPGPIMWTFQSDEDGREHMLTRAMPLWKSCQPLKAIWPTDRHKQTNTEVYFPTFYFLANGANPNSLQSKSIRWKFNSELWLPQWQPLYQQAVARVAAFARMGRSKIVNDSQSGNQGDVMDKAFHSGHQARWSAPCPSCGKVIALRASQRTEDGRLFGMVWADDAQRKDRTWDVGRVVETVRWRCSCGSEMPDSPQTRNYWNANGRYVPDNPSAPLAVRSFWWGSVHVHPMRELARAKAEALNLAHRGDMADLKTHLQQRENESWEEQHVTVSLSGGRSGVKVADFENGQTWDGEVRRSMTVDRQQGIAGDFPHRWVEIRAWRAGGASMQLWFGRVNTKEACREVQQRYNVPDRCVWQDARFEKHQVFQECAEYGWLAVFGTDRSTWVHYTKGPRGEMMKVTLPYSPIQVGLVAGTVQKVRYLLFSEDYFADLLSNLVSGRGVDWLRPDDGLPEYLDHLKAEHKVQRRPGVWSWEKIHSTKANHGWDTSKMAVCFCCVVRLMALPQTPAKGPPVAALEGGEETGGAAEVQAP